MKRKIFFFLDRLQIKRSERLVISILMTTAMLISSLLFWAAPETYNSEEKYAELEQVFNERSRIQQTEQENIMARYNPELDEAKSISKEQVRVDTVDSDTVAQENTDESFININSADATELQELPGIGPAYSVRIVEWRAENGSFSAKNQLLEIKGIGPARFEQIKDLIEL
ncbi:MAG: helix-hairpin-helix domain-containing protein [Balneolaceae bacterium]